MLTDEQKQQIAQQGAAQMRGSWQDTAVAAIANAVDDVRARLIDEAWFERSADLQAVVRESVDRADVYGQDLQVPELDHDREAAQDDALGR